MEDFDDYEEDFKDFKGKENYKEKAKNMQVKGMSHSEYRFIVCAIFAIVFLMCAIALGVLYTNSNLTKNEYGNSLEATYNRSVYELVQNINDVELNLNKTKVSGSESLQRKYLQLVCDNCKYAQSNFALLPVNISTAREGVKFVNQVDGFCTSLISQNNALNTEQKQKIQELIDITGELKIILNALVDKIVNGYSVLAGSADANLELDEFSSNFVGFSSDSISYPSMIFDGPFSDSLQDREIKGLPSSELDEAAARSNLAALLDTQYDVNEIKYLGMTQGDFVTYDYEITQNGDDAVLIAQVTKRGGFLLTLTGESNQSESEVFTKHDCLTTAKNFCNQAGVSDMQEVWSETSKGIAVLNLAPVISSIIYYPDLIKIKVDMSTNKVIGYEAQNYAYNHTERTKTTPSLGATEARSLVSPTLNIITQKLVIMPLEYSGEVLAYEFVCEYFGADYFVYINAFNGKEERIMKVVSTQEGALLS